MAKCDYCGNFPGLEAHACKNCGAPQQSITVIVPHPDFANAYAESCKFRARYLSACGIPKHFFDTTPKDSGPLR